MTTETRKPVSEINPSGWHADRRWIDGPMGFITREHAEGWLAARGFGPVRWYYSDAWCQRTRHNLPGFRSVFGEVRHPNGRQTFTVAEVVEDDTRTVRVYAR
jgi:hypothetical protein